MAAVGSADHRSGQGLAAWLRAVKGRGLARQTLPFIIRQSPQEDIPQSQGQLKTVSDQGQAADARAQRGEALVGGGAEVGPALA